MEVNFTELANIAFHKITELRDDPRLTHDGKLREIKGILNWLLIKLEKLGCDSRDLVDTIIQNYFFYNSNYSFMLFFTLEDSKFSGTIKTTPMKMFLLGTDLFNSRFIRLLVRYGILNIRQEAESSIKYGSAKEYLKFFWLHVRAVLDARGDKGNEMRHYLTLQQLQDTYSSLTDGDFDTLQQLQEISWSLIDRGIRRPFVMIMILKGMVLKQLQDPLVGEFVQCMRMYFAVSREPFVTNCEMAKYMHCMLKDKVPAEFITQLVDDYTELFCESDRPYAPRSLKHLSRCVIRETIYREADILPNRVKTLNVPKRVQDYILCESEYYLNLITTCMALDQLSLNSV